MKQRMTANVLMLCVLIAGVVTPASFVQAEESNINYRAFDYVDRLPDRYRSFKKELHDQYGFDYQIRAGFLAQRGAPNGKNTVFRDKYEVEANWDFLKSDTIGDGSLSLLYEDINYSHIEGTKMTTRLGVSDPINDDAFRREYFKRFVYTHRLPGKMDWLSLSFGQFLIGSFGKISYKSVPLYHFNNFALAKNMTKGYPTGGVGGYVTLRVIDNVTLIAGAQDTTNYFPQNISFKNIDENKWTNFLYVLYTPKLTNKGKTVISGWVYHSPAIKKYSGQFNKAFLKPSDGFNLTVRQDLSDKWTVFGKINASTGNRMCMEQSYVMNVMYNNPLNRNELDQIGVGVGVNKLSKLNKNTVRKWENVVEAYWSWGVSNFMIVTPDIQCYLNPALTKERDTVIVTSMTAKFLF